MKSMHEDGARVKHSLSVKNKHVTIATLAAELLAARAYS